MKKTGCFSSTFSFLIGIFLVFEGIWGLISDNFLWIFSTNQLQASFLLFLGVLGVRMCFWQKSVMFCYFLGGLHLITGFSHFIPATDQITNILNMNNQMAYLTIGIGMTSVFCGVMGND